MYNFQGLSSTVEEWVKEVQKLFGKLDIVYEPEKLRNEIAKTWPVALDDTCARKDWNWKPQYSKTKELISRMVMDIADIEKKNKNKV